MDSPTLSHPRTLSLFTELKDTVNAVPVRGGIMFQWSRKSVGFGCLTLTVKRGKLEVDAEGMGPDFCASVVRQAIGVALKKGDKP